MDLAIILPIIRPGAQWSLSGNSLAGLTWHGPGDPPTQQECEDAWAQLQATETARKTWPSTEKFMDEFTHAEKAAIELSTDADVAALKLTLATWRGRVFSDDERVVMGLGLLVSLGIISAERRDEINAKP